MLDVNAMILFAKVVDARSYSEASRTLGIPKSTLSRKISQMEEHLGVRLLQRNTRNLCPTELGNEVYKNSLNILREMEQVQATVENSHQDVSGALRVNISISLSQQIIASLCAGFMKQYPKVELELYFSESCIDLIGSRYDVAVLFGPLADSEFVARPLFERDMILVASPQYLRLHGSPDTPTSLSKHQGILLGQHKSLPIWPLGLGKTKELVSFKSKVSTNSATMVLEMAKNSHGIAMVTKVQCQRELNNGELSQIMADTPLEPLQVYGVYCSRHQLARKISVFIDYFVKHFDSHESEHLGLSNVRAIKPSF
ncbi:MAG: LysR family transcriptional regulator [Alteromonadaceae bacterium]|nr:MAG: LysR family transcriptional regulator [Alteromonadaceae bacterium]